MGSGKGKQIASRGAEDAVPATPAALGRLFDALAEQSTGQPNNARTAKLLAAGVAKMSQKLVEEAAEVALDAVRERRDGVISESADLLYHLVVLWFALGIDPTLVWAEMDRREQMFGLAEKLPKTRP